MKSYLLNQLVEFYQTNGYKSTELIQKPNALVFRQKADANIGIRIIATLFVVIPLIWFLVHYLKHQELLIKRPDSGYLGAFILIGGALLAVDYLRSALVFELDFKAKKINKYKKDRLLKSEKLVANPDFYLSEVRYNFIPIYTEVGIKTPAGSMIFGQFRKKQAAEKYLQLLKEVLESSN
jgi:hypothetical protein